MNDADIPYAHKSEWTSVTDALPVTYTRVLVFIPAMVDFGELDRYVVAYYDGEDWYTTDGEHVRPAYWMEIPAIPDLGKGDGTVKTLAIDIHIEVETEWDECLVERNAERLVDDFATDIASMDATDYPVIDVCINELLWLKPT